MAESDFQLSCPKCSTLVSATIEQAGETIVCRRCDNKLLVPGQKHKSKDVTVDDLISFDDDVLNPNSHGEEIVARAVDESVDEAIPVEAEVTESAQPESPDMDSELRVAEESVADAPFDSSPDEKEEPGGVDVIDESSDSDDDLGDLIDIRMESAPVADAKDPFEVDDNANLVVEGVTPQDHQFGVVCNLCGSLLYATVSQVGTKIKCHDCHSLVEVHPPREEPKPVEKFETRPDDEGERGYQLSDPYELEPIDTTIDKTLEIDYNDDDFFEKRREMQRRQMDAEADQSQSELPTDPGDSDGLDPEVVDDGKSDAAGERAQDDGANDLEVGEFKVEDPFDVAAGEYGLAPAESLPTPEPGHPQFTRPPTAPDPKDERSPEKVMPDVSSELADEDIPVRVEPERELPAEGEAKSAGEAKSESGSAIASTETRTASKKKTGGTSRRAASPNDKNLDHASLFGDPGNWMKQLVTPLTNVNCLIRLALAAAAIGICYMFIFAGAGRFGEESNQMQKFVGFALIAMGGLPMFVILAIVGITANPIVRVAMERENSLAEWPEFSMADWLSQFIYLATSFWLAAFPGVIFGSFLAATYRTPVPLVFAIIISSLMFTPFFLSSVVFNESPWAVASPEVFRALKPLRNRWIRFMLVAFLIGILIPLATLLAGFGILAIAAAGIQVALLFVYYWLLGDLTGHVVRWMMSQSDENNETS